MIAVRAHPDNPGESHLKSFVLISPAEALPNERTFIGFKDWDMDIFWDTISQPPSEAFRDSAFRFLEFYITS